MFATEQRSNSHSPNRGGLGSKISSLGAKLSRTFSNSNDVDQDSAHSGLPVLPKENRSQSRGREPLQSTGRGGFGNIRQASVSRDRPDSGPDDFSVTRGREPIANPEAIYSTGRGGAGNLRSPSRDASRGPDPHEKVVIENYVAHQGEVPVSTGRGGLGNINRSRSRDHSRTRTVTTGRGGAGNFREGDGYDANVADELERKKEHHLSPGPHSTGRGGIANITEQEEPEVERPSVSSSNHASTGRGGAGNIVRN